MICTQNTLLNLGINIIFLDLMIIDIIIHKSSTNVYDINSKSEDTQYIHEVVKHISSTFLSCMFWNKITVLQTLCYSFCIHIIITCNRTWRNKCYAAMYNRAKYHFIESVSDANIRIFRYMYILITCMYTNVYIFYIYHYGCFPSVQLYTVLFHTYCK